MTMYKVISVQSKAHKWTAEYTAVHVHRLYYSKSHFKVAIRCPLFAHRVLLGL